MAGRADASGDRYAISSAPSGAITVEIEFYGTAYTNQYDALFWMGQSASGGTAYDRAIMAVFGNPANNMEIWACDSTAARVGPAATGGAWLTNTWHRVTIVIEGTTAGSNILLYADGSGTPLDTGTVGNANTYLAQRIEIGNDVNSDNAVNVRSANVVVTNRAFTANEVVSRQALPFHRRAAGAWGAWTLDDDTAAGLRDWSGNGRNLTETGTMTVTETASRTVVVGPTTFGDQGWGHSADPSGTTYDSNISGALSFSGSLQKQVNKPIAGALSFVGVMQKQTSKTFSGVLSFAGALASQAVFLRAVAGALSFAGALQRQANKQVAGALSFAGNMQRQTNKVLSGALSFSGALARAFTRTALVTGVLSFAGALGTLFIAGPGAAVRFYYRKKRARTRYF